MSASGGGRGPAVEVFLVFLRLGLTCFGGPVAHIGYFRREFVSRRHWLDEDAFTNLLALCQFLPGPASSQMGFSIGLLRAGAWGALAAFAGFTLPSAILLGLFARYALFFSGRAGSSVAHGLKLVAVAIVAQAVWSMAQSLCPDRRRAAIALGGLLVTLSGSGPAAQIEVILLGAVAGLGLCRGLPAGVAAHAVFPLSRAAGFTALCAFLALLLLLPLLASITGSPGLALFNAFYRSGALVFGGGHVVLPLLRQAFVVPGWVDQGSFLAGYGAAQAVPGPLFTFAAFLGFVARPQPHGIAGALLGVAGIFLPGMLVLTGALPFWEALRRSQAAQAALRGVNAAVVGLLAGALYNPIWTSSVATPADFGLAATGFLLLTRWQAPPLLVVVLSALGGVLLAPG